MIDPELLRQGGFAFAALVMAGLLIWGAKVVVGFANKREEFIDQLMRNNTEISAAVTLNAEATKTLTTTVSSSLSAQTEAIREMTRELRDTRVEVARSKGGL